MSAPSGGSWQDRFDVRSSDRTSLAVWVDGDGPALVMAHGGTSEHTTYLPILEELRDGVTVYAMDRRGRGGSTDATVDGDDGEYSIEREFDDVATVVDAVAARVGAPVALWGHSYGADCAMGAATRTRNVDRLVIYEPGFGIPCPEPEVEKVEALLEAGDREGALRALLVDIVGMTVEEFDVIRSSPTWSTRLDAVPTVPRELRAESGWTYRPGQFDGITAPTLVLAGSESPPAQAEASRRAAGAIRAARIRVLEGHAHIAHQTAPALVAGVIREFLDV